MIEDGLPNEDDDDQADDTPAQTVNLSDPKSVRRARDRNKREVQEEESFWRAVLNDKVGRRVMYRFFTEQCHGHAPPFACGPNGFPNPQATWFQAGQYALGQYLHQRWMLQDPDGLKLMMDEHDPRFIQKQADRRRKIVP